MKRFIFASTIYIYSKRRLCSTSKLCSEKIIEQYSENYNLKYTVLDLDQFMDQMQMNLIGLIIFLKIQLKIIKL